MFSEFIAIIQSFLTEPAILIGLLVGLGYALDKKSPIKIITGMVSAMVGLMMVLFGGFQFSATFKPVADAVSQSYGIHGYLMDSYAMKAATQIALGDNFGFVGYVFVLAFFTNLLLVLLGRYTRVKGIFLTGNTGVSHSQAVLWLIVFWLGLGWVPSIIIAGILTGLFWAFATTLIAKPIAKITNNAGFTIAHNQMLGIWFFSKFAHLFGDAEKQDAENMKLPGWLAIFNHNVTSIAIVMTLFVGGFLLTTGIDNVQAMAKGKPWYIYIINLGLQFSMYMVILLQGVRMMVGEINASFKGWQDRLIPDAIPAVDVAALLPFSPNADAGIYLLYLRHHIFDGYSAYHQKSHYGVAGFCAALFLRRSYWRISQPIRWLPLRYYLHLSAGNDSNLWHDLGHSAYRPCCRGSGLDRYF